jgi:hypothetical protein
LVPVDPLIIVLADFASMDGELKGLQVLNGDGFHVARLPGESEEDLEHRAYEQVKAHGRRKGLSLLTVMEDREKRPYIRPQPGLEPAAPTIRPGC